jgi:hypothetical protein
MLTELQAWEHLAFGFAKPTTLMGHAGWAEILPGKYNECLCHAVSTLLYSGKIDSSVDLLMRKKIARYAGPHRTTALDNTFFWSRDQLGAIQRSGFCMRMLKQQYEELFSWCGIRELSDPYSMWYI